MKINLFTFSFTAIIVVLPMLTRSYGWADSDKDYCFDEVGDGHPCFDTKEKCKIEQEKDEIPESPGYSKYAE